MPSLFQVKIKNQQIESNNNRNILPLRQYSSHSRLHQEHIRPRTKFMFTPKKLDGKVINLMLERLIIGSSHLTEQSKTDVKSAISNTMEEYAFLAQKW